MFDRDKYHFEGTENGVDVLKSHNGSWHYIGTIVDKTIDDVDDMTDGELKWELINNGIIDY